MRDHRMGLVLITEVLGVLERHGYVRGNDEHAGRAIFLIGDLARIYEGSQEHPFGPSLNEIPPRTEPAPPAPATRDAVLVPVGEVKTLLVALDIAADDMRDRAELCADCSGQSCPACESRLRDALAYDHLHEQLIQSAEAADAAPAGRPGPTAESQPPADREAGQ